MSVSNRNADTPRTLDFAITRELEILISAALVFSLLQLPEVLDQWWARTEIHLGGSSFIMAFVLYYVGKLFSYGLIAAFAAHFLLRGLWVALWGLQSALPGGIDYAKLDAGPISTSVYRERLMTPNEMESRIDKIASSIFSFVFMFMILLLMISILSGICWAIASGLAAIIPGAEVGPLFIGIGLLISLANLAVVYVDKWTRKKQRQLSRKTQKFMRGFILVFHYLALNFLYAPIFLTFATRVSRRTISIIQTSFMYVMIGIFVVTVFADAGLIRFDDYLYYPNRAPSRTVDARHYASLRPADDPITVPTIQSEVVEGPYLRLFVPYDAFEDNERMDVLCRGLEPLRTDSLTFESPRKDLPPERVEALMSCLSSIHEVTLDGEVIEPDWTLHTEPGANVPGRLAMIDTRAMAPGKHLIVVRHVPLPEGVEDEKADEHFIPFWK